MSQRVRLVLVAACILVDGSGRVLMAQRPEGKDLAGLWEFPGGKIEDGEKPEDALVRELHEELGIVIDASDLRPLTFASHTYPRFHLLMPLFVCHRWQGEVTAVEHQSIAWVTAQDLHTLPMPPADLPLIDVLTRPGALAP